MPVFNQARRFASRTALLDSVDDLPKSRFAHRTETVDYAILLSGELDLELDVGEVVHLKPGDVVVQRGTVHTWVNRGSVPAVTAFILIDAKPVEVAGEVLGTHFPA